MKITPARFFSYTMMPRIFPMVRELFGSGFGHVAFYMAQIYAAARLLPANHPYLNAQNIGRFGVSSVILEASRNLRFTRNHIDQISIFVLILAGIGILLAQIFLLGFALFVQTAKAMPTSYTGFFETPVPDNDIAFILMDRVFGIPGLFDSCVAKNISCIRPTAIPDGPFPFPYHGALHDLLGFYSMGLAVIGMIIFMYYIVAIGVETAQTGTPFGRRFNHVWAPIRMIVALALLIPISMGFNSAQLLTLHIAKWGSSLATNGWNIFVNVLVGSNLTMAFGYAIDPVSGNIVEARLVGDPQKPKPNELLRFYTVLATCVQAYQYYSGIKIDAYLVRTGPAAPSSSLLLSNDWQQASDFFNKDTIKVVFGQKDAANTEYTGEVRPYCGEVTFSPTDLTEAGSVAIQTGYYEQFIRQPWRNIDSKGTTVLMAAANLPAPSNAQQDMFWFAAQNVVEVNIAPDVSTALNPNIDSKNSIMTWWDQQVGVVLTNGIAQMAADTDWLVQLDALGWGGAGIWYNKIAQLNGAAISAAANLPGVSKWPAVMEKVAEEKAKQDKGSLAETIYKPYLSNGVKIKFDDAKDFQISGALFSAYNVWNGTAFTEFDGVTSVETHSGQNVLIDLVNAFFGTQGLFNMANNTAVHPLAQVVTMGKYMLFTAIRNLSIGAAGSAAAAPIQQALSLPAGSEMIAQALAGFFWTCGMMTISLGFILYYVVPFLPFLYFFFQVGGWVKGLFEAMVGLPLWALAHIRIDGQGLAGDAAMNGYFLIFEIFLRPILTIFGLVGGISIFAAQVQVLNDVFWLVASNVSGFDRIAAAKIPTTAVGAFTYARAGIDQLFYTVIYAILVYMIGTSSFKLVYLIPNNMLRWMGSSVDGFGEIAKDAPESLVGTMYTSSSVITGQMRGASAALIGTMK